ncbi:MAG: HEAT repeat domain-containing protein [Phycisphaerales bacterium]
MGGCAAGPQKQPSRSQAAGAGGAQPQPAPATAASTPALSKSKTRELAISIIEQASGSTDPQVRANAVEAAGYSATRLRDIVARGLTDPSPAVRSVAAMTVARVGLNDLADSVYPLLGDAEPHVRASAILALVRTGRDVDRSPLAPMLLEDSSPWVRRHAAWVLGEIRDNSALPLLRSAAVDPLPSATRAQAKLFQLHVAEAMAKLGDAKARQSLRGALYPSQPEELEAVAVAVGMIAQFKDRESYEQVAPLAKYKDRDGNPYPAEIRLAVAAALASLGDPSLARIADPFAVSSVAAQRAQAAFVYADAGDAESASRLAGLLQDSEEAVRVAAAGAVLRAGGRH